MCSCSCCPEDCASCLATLPIWAALAPVAPLGASCTSASSAKLSSVRPAAVETNQSVQDAMSYTAGAGRLCFGDILVRMTRKCSMEMKATNLCTGLWPSVLLIRTRLSVQASIIPLVSCAHKAIAQICHSKATDSPTSGSSTRLPHQRPLSSPPDALAER